MRKLATGLGLAIALSFGQMGPAAAAIDDIVGVEKGEVYTWDGETTPASNANYFGLVGDNEAVPAGTCNKDRTTYCQVFLFKIINPITEEEKANGVIQKTAQVKVRIDWAETPVVHENTGVEPTDFDLVGFASNDLGDKLEQVGQSAQGDTTSELFAFPAKTTLEEPATWVLLEVVYFAVPNANGYTGTFEVV